jgi:hypothetical protein
MDFNKLAGQASSFMNKGSGGSAQAQQAPISGQNQDLSGGGAGQQSFVGDNSGTGMQPSTDPNSSLTQGGVQGQNVNASGQEDYGDKGEFVCTAQNTTHPQEHARFVDLSLSALNGRDDVKTSLPSWWSTRDCWYRCIRTANGRCTHFCLNLHHDYTHVAFSPSLHLPLCISLAEATWNRVLTSSTFTAFDFVAKKSGHNMDRNTSEKITDGARGMFEKVTGKKVDSKYSN